MPEPAILDRDDELRELGVAVEAATLGRGGVRLISGPAGIGKTVLLREVRGQAEAAGARVFRAAASPLDRDFPFGLVHQLFDEIVASAPPDRRERLLAGAASRAGVVLGPSADLELPADPGHAVLHGLYWFVANLTEEGPVVLLVDDLHWSDRASLRLLEYLGRRLEALPLLIAGTARPNEPGAERELLLAIEAAASASVIRPRAFGAGAIAALLEQVVGRAPSETFATACGDATGGNPLLLTVLAAQVAERRMTGQPDEVAAIAGLAATELRALVQRRLAGLGRDAAAIAAAAAVLGDPARLDDLAAVSGLDPAATRAAADRLVAAELLEPAGWAFVHPIVRAAVVEATAPARLARLHAGAAERLRRAHARPARIALHLLSVDPAGDPRVVADLLAAARAAAAEGAPEAGAVHLRRALEEPPAEADRAGLLLELGELEQRAGEPAAIAHLTTALEGNLTADQAARALASRGAVRLHVDPIPDLGELQAALDRATDPALRLRLEAVLLEASVFHEASVGERAVLLAAGRAAEDRTPVMLSHLAQDSAFGGRPVAETIAFATGATGGGALLRAIGPANSTFNLLVHAFRSAERPDAARELLDQGERLARREGLRFAAFFLEHAAAYWEWEFGSVAAGVAHARTGLDKVWTGGFDATAPALIAPLGELLVEADRLDDAAAVVDQLAPGLEELVGSPFALAARGVVRRRQNRREDAEADLRSAIAHFEARGWHQTAAAGPVLELAELLAEPERRDEGLELARRSASVLEAAGLAGWTAVAGKVEGLLTGGEAGLERLADAAGALAGSPLRLQRGWALYELGAALRRAGRRGDAREPLRAALDVAARVESARLTRLAREELLQTGARPLRDALTGPASLTPSERRVADLALNGLTNREIAETLWVTRKTVELHLRGAYAKLGIGSRRQLPDVLGSASRPGERAA